MNKIIYKGYTIEEYDDNYRVLREKIDVEKSTLYRIYEDFDFLDDAFDYIDTVILIDKES